MSAWKKGNSAGREIYVNYNSCFTNRSLQILIFMLNEWVESGGEKVVARFLVLPAGRNEGFPEALATACGLKFFPARTNRARCFESCLEKGNKLLLNARTRRWFVFRFGVGVGFVSVFSFVFIFISAWNLLMQCKSCSGFYLLFLIDVALFVFTRQLEKNIYPIFVHARTLWAAWKIGLAARKSWNCKSLASFFFGILVTIYTWNWVKLWHQ